MERPAPTSILDGRYRLLRVLPGEPTTERYLGVARAMPSRAVLIKRVPESLARNKPTVARFLDEARTTALLRHPAIPAVLDVGEDAGTFVAVFEHLPGVDASQLLERLAARKQHLPVPLAARLVSVVLEALAHAHAAQDGSGQPLELVHRDVSAATVRVGYDGQVRLGGFGLAKQRESENTSFGVIRGQLASTAPEQLVPGPIDARVDLWATGVLLYELLTGLKPFERAGEFHILKAIREEEPAPPSSLRPELGASLDGFIARALSKDRAARFQSADQMRAALAECVAPEGEALLAAEVTALFAEQLGPYRLAARDGQVELKGALTLEGGVPTAAEVARDVLPDDEPSETGKVEIARPGARPRPPQESSDPSQPSLTPSVTTDPAGRAPIAEPLPRASSREVRPPSRPALPQPRPPSRPSLPAPRPPSRNDLKPARRKRRFRLVTEKGIHPAIHPLVAVVAVLMGLAAVRRSRPPGLVELAPLAIAAEAAAPAPPPRAGVVPARAEPAPAPVPEPVDAGDAEGEHPAEAEVALASDPELRHPLDRHPGTLRVEAPRRSRVLVDGRAISGAVSLPAGPHKLHVVLPGGAVREETVRIEAGRTLRRSYADKVVPPQPKGHWP